MKAHKEKDILFFHYYNDYTGSTRVLRNIIEKEYINRQVTVICLQRNVSGFLSEVEGVTLIAVKPLKIFGKKIPIISGILLRMEALYKSFFYGIRYKTFYLNTVMPYWGALAGLVLHKKLIYHIHERHLKSSLFTFLPYKIFDIVCSHRIFVSKYLSESFKNNSKCTSEVKYNYLPPSFIKNVQITPVDKRELRNITMICSLHKGKGIDNFIKVATKMSNYNFTLVISTDFNTIKNTFCDIEKIDNLTVLPTQDNIHPILRNTDLIMNLTNPTYTIETFGMTLLEGMAYGIPCICPNVGGPLEIVINDYNGYAIDVTDIDKIAEAIDKIMDKNNYCRFSNNAIVFSEKFH